MHRTYEFDVTDALKRGKNRLRIEFKSPTRWIREAQQRDPIGGTPDAMQGFPHLRKAHCMFGWDCSRACPTPGSGAASSCWASAAPALRTSTSDRSTTKAMCCFGRSSKSPARQR